MKIKIWMMIKNIYLILIKNSFVINIDIVDLNDAFKNIYI